MYYVIRNQKMSTWVETRDGVIVSAPASMRPFINREVIVAIEWAQHERLHVYVAQHDAAEITKLEQV